MDLHLRRTNFNGPEGRRYEIVLDRNEVVVGRSAESHRTIPDPLISRRHLKFARDGDRWTVTDMSMNGVLKNGQRLTKGVASELCLNDTLQLDPMCNYTYLVEQKCHSPPAKRPRTAQLNEDAERKLEEEKRHMEEEKRRIEDEKQRIEDEKQRMEDERQRVECEKQRMEDERQQVENEKRRIEEEKLKVEQEKQNQEARLKQYDQLEERLHQVTEEMQDKERRQREQLQEQEAALKRQLAAETERLQREREQIEDNLKGELEATNLEREQTAEQMRQRCDAIETQLSALDRKRQLLESQLASVEKEKEAACGEQLMARQKVLDGFGQLMEAELTCSICSELFLTAVTLSCTHTFCTACIDQWLKQRTTCPICRNHVTGRTRSIVLENFIDGMVARLGGEAAEHRQMVRRERQAAVAAAAAPPPAAPGRGGRGGRRGGRGARGRHVEYQQQQRILQQLHQQQQQQQRQAQQQRRVAQNTRGRGRAAPAPAQQRGRAPLAPGALATAINAALAAGANPDHPIVIDDTAYYLQMQ